jgi:E3 SUMO-protein ligase PIAS1
MLTSLSLVITNAVYKNDADTLRRLQYRVQHHGDAPPTAASSSSPAAPTYTQPPTPTANGYNMTNGYGGSAGYSSYQTPQVPARKSPRRTMASSG